MQSPRNDTAPSVPTTPVVDRLMYLPEEASEIVGLTVHWLIKAAREKRIPHRRVGTLYRFTREDLEAITAMHAQPVGKKAAK
jgi:excisionase family DNA binding protein